MATKKREKRYKVFLRAFSADGSVVESDVITVEEYYDGSPELIDSSEYRSKHGIVRLTVDIHGPSGTLDQSVEVFYSGKGDYLRRRAVFADGTVQED